MFQWRWVGVPAMWLPFAMGCPVGRKQEGSHSQRNCLCSPISHARTHAAQTDSRSAALWYEESCVCMHVCTHMYVLCMCVWGGRGGRGIVNMHTCVCLHVCMCVVWSFVLLFFTGQASNWSLQICAFFLIYLCNNGSLFSLCLHFRSTLRVMWLWTSVW